ncbi:hypothetical protein [Arenibaculum pallidiluteum]|uniref:hypothetical protein n=1 Tax=Arenibaculum pallidiluteum TaxID=2812559 RepID=UPI001A97630E|nr:hypothetical protein [Arenibaculum pallidiluteum]
MNEDPEEREAFGRWVDGMPPSCWPREWSSSDHAAFFFAAVVLALFASGMIRQELLGQDPVQVATFTWGGLSGVAGYAILALAHRSALARRRSRLSPPSGRRAFRHVGAEAAARSIAFPGTPADGSREAGRREIGACLRPHRAPPSPSAPPVALHAGAASEPIAGPTSP